MDVAFKAPALDRLETDAGFSAGFSDAIVKAYRKAMQHIRAASDERTFYARRSPKQNAFPRISNSFARANGYDASWTGAHWFGGARKRVSHGMLKIIHKPLRHALKRSADSATSHPGRRCPSPTGRLAHSQ